LNSVYEIKIITVTQFAIIINFGGYVAHITISEFQNRFVSLILGGRDLPKKRLDRHILFISSILKLEPERLYSESELNDELRKWTIHFGTNFGLDHVTLRRFLIDERYINRDSAGMTYELETADLPFTFDPSIEKLDLEELINEAKREREERKQRFMKEAKE
jgi:hypothetical protein